MSTWTLIDTETDGFNSPIHVIDIAAQKFEGLEPVGKPFQAFLDHNITIPAEATAVHGYTTSFISKHGRPPGSVYKELRAFVAGDPVSSHYIPFDWNRTLIPELIRLKEPLFGQRGFCTLALARRTLPEHPSHKLDLLRDFYGLACSRPHSALGDVESVVDLLTRIIFPRLASIGFDSLEKVQEFLCLQPLLRCKSLILGLDYEEERRRIIESKEEKRRFEKFLTDVTCGLYPIPSLIIDYNLIEEEPAIQFEGKRFLFTGKMAWGSRATAATIIQERGGMVSDSNTISRELDYLVLGEDAEKGWTALLNGGKLTQAFLKRVKDPTLPLRIVREEDFIAALLNSMNTTLDQIQQLEARIQQLRSQQHQELKDALAAARKTVADLEAQIAAVTGGQAPVAPTRARMTSEEVRSRILKALAAAPEGLGQKAIADQTGVGYQTVIAFMRANGTELQDHRGFEDDAIVASKMDA